MDESVHKSGVKWKLDNDYDTEDEDYYDDDSDDDFFDDDDEEDTLLVEKLAEKVTCSLKTKQSSSRERKFTDIQETGMNAVKHNCEVKQRMPHDGGGDVSNAVLTEKQKEEVAHQNSEDNKLSSKDSKLTDLLETAMDETDYNCEVRQRKPNNNGSGDVGNAVPMDEPVEEGPSHDSEDNKSSSKESMFRGLQETAMDETDYNCEVRQRKPNNNGSGDVGNAVPMDELVEEVPLHDSEDNKSSSKKSMFKGLQETDEMIDNCEIGQLIANDDDGGDVSNAVLPEKQVEEDPSHYSEDKSSSIKEGQFTDPQERGNNEVLPKHDACVEDETTVNNLKNLRDMDMDIDMENGINAEYILSCLKSLQCPFVWKPDKEVEIHPRGEVPINLAQHLTEKERGFICMERDLFREVTIYLVLAYHKYITMLPKEGLLDIYHCYDILLKAEKEILNVSMEQADEDTKRKETDISNVSKPFTQSTEGDLNSPLTNCEVLPVMSDSGNSSHESQNDYEVTLKTETAWTPSVTKSADNSSRYVNQGKVDTGFLLHDVEETELFAKLFDKDTLCEWTNANTVQKNVFENWKTENNNANNESCSSSSKTPADKTERCVETQLYSRCKTEQEKEKESQKLCALKCVTAASLAYFAFSFGCGQDAMRIIEYTEKLSKSLNSVGEAVILALRAAVLCEYGYVGNKLALPLFKEALKVDPDNWEWNLYCAKVIGRLRRNEKTCNTEPSEEEIQMLKKAVELNPTNPSCLVHLANAYRTVAGAQYRQRMAAQAGSACDDPLLNSRLQRNWRSSRSSWRQDELWKQMPVTSKGNKEYLSMAKELYLEALKYGRNCPYTNARCAKGLWSMPNPYKDKKIAQETILHALCLAPDDSLVNHHAGMFYEYCHDYDKALNCYEIATQNGKFNYPAEMNYINLRLKIAAPGSYSPIFRLHGLLHKYNGVNHMVQTLCLRGYYHYEVEKILLLAIQNFAMAIELKPTSPILVDFYPGQMLKNYPESVNLYDLLEQILHEFEKHPEHNANKDIVKYATDILKMGNKIRNESCASSTTEN